MIPKKPYWLEVFDALLAAVVVYLLGFYTAMFFF